MWALHPGGLVVGYGGRRRYLWCKGSQTASSVKDRVQLTVIILAFENEEAFVAIPQGEGVGRRRGRGGEEGEGEVDSEDEGEGMGCRCGRMRWTVDRVLRCPRMLKTGGWRERERQK